jgi:DNA-binding LacI/PurR family transcriptional regulator
VIGFDDVEAAALADPPLTTLRQHTVEQGRAMATLLAALLGRTPPDPGPGLDPDGVPHVVLPVELVVRASA